MSRSNPCEFNAITGATHYLQTISCMQPVAKAVCPSIKTVPQVWLLYVQIACLLALKTASHFDNHVCKQLHSLSLCRFLMIHAHCVCQMPSASSWIARPCASCLRSGTWLRPPLPQFPAVAWCTWPPKPLAGALMSSEATYISIL